MRNYPEGQQDHQSDRHSYTDNGWGNDEWQEYTNSADNVHVENDNLVIAAQCPSGVYGKRDGSITSARVTTKDKFSIKHGKVMARIKPPKGAGIWPAFWMLGSNFDTDGWPQCGEIDIMEISPLFHDDKTTLFTLHWWDDDADPPAWTYFQQEKDLDFSLADDYHIFEVDWDEHRIIGKIDDHIYFVKMITPGSMDEFLNDFFILLNIAVGGNLGGSPDASTIWPQEMLVDWVRAYKKISTSTTAGIYTESHTDLMLDYNRIIDSQEWGGNRAVPDQKSVDVTPVDGEYTLAVKFIDAGAGWGGTVFSCPHSDISDYANLIFSINTSAADTSFSNLNIEIEDSQGGKTSVRLDSDNYTPTISGDWARYEIPLSDFTAVDLTDIIHLGFWNPVDDSNTMVFGTLYFDDIFLQSTECSDAGSVSLNAETYTTTTSSATITVSDPCAASSLVIVSVDNGSETIVIGVTTDASGVGTGTLHFGATNDNTDAIAISEGDLLTVTYTDASGNVRTDAADIEAGSSTEITMGIFSESHTQSILVYDQIINSADWSGNPATPDETNTDVAPADGSYVLAVDYGDAGAGWGGIAFNFGETGQDITDYTTLVFSIDTSVLPDFSSLGVKFEDSAGGMAEVYLASYAPVISENWAKYEIPLLHFPATDLTDVIYLGLWTPVDASGALIFGTIYFDDIHLLFETIIQPTEPAGLFSESHTESIIAYEQIINSADWSGNPATPDETNTDVAPLDGTYVLAVDYADAGAGWGGIAFSLEGGGQDISAYSTLIFSIDTSAFPNFYDLGVKIEDASQTSTQVQLPSYTPVISANWATYEIPLSDFTDPYLTAVKYIGFWNPADNAGAMIFGILYFDDIYLDFVTTTP
ncbi:MAG: glycoside hydrolase family 16 protein [Planctomycetes bacterium]|nr:glycoside hydrolase family 16 protein [Planctomycetota bacterium]